MSSAGGTLASTPEPVRCQLCGQRTGDALLRHTHPDAEPLFLLVLCGRCRRVLAKALAEPAAPRAAPEPAEPYLTTLEVGRLLRLRPATVRRQIANGRLRAVNRQPAGHPRGARYLVRRADVQQLLDGGRGRAPDD